MTLTAVKAKLYEYIDKADAKKANALLSMLKNELSEPGLAFDEETLDMLNKRWDNYLSGNTKTYTIAESMERIRKHRMKNGL